MMGLCHPAPSLGVLGHKATRLFPPFCFLLCSFPFFVGLSCCFRLGKTKRRGKCWLGGEEEGVHLRSRYGFHSLSSFFSSFYLFLYLSTSLIVASISGRGRVKEEQQRGKKEREDKEKRASSALVEVWEFHSPSSFFYSALCFFLYFYFFNLLLQLQVEAE